MGADVAIDRLHARRGELARTIYERLGEAVPDARTVLDPAHRAGVLAALDAALDHGLDALAREYQRGRGRDARSPDQRRAALISRLLDEDLVGPVELTELDYPFDAWHVGVIAMGARAQDAVTALRDDRRLLWVPDGGDVAWAWLGGRRRPTHTDMQRLHLDGASEDVSLAVGEPARGLRGWRQTHRQARQALRVALLASRARVRYADVALLVPWLEDPDRGRALVDACLSPLDSQRDGGAAAREALRAYFRARRNATAAASALGCERRTLAYRLRAIEGCLGHRLDDRFAELEVALELRELLATDVR